ncbi:enolase-phosphatase E1-like [Dendroctonus ponderosae]|uniref:enolase-phosphatase E1-like n=1 Tax=Dendroctonus ponderosae TaxID=77166 RepID=UPI002035BA42|nr:enolase-phosphatase E1-like [Dendroctonus ponderosae]XP_048523940.1 enolase-phosphatase E1-like [Dendroctonus ponderosae]
MNKGKETNTKRKQMDTSANWEELAENSRTLENIPKRRSLARSPPTTRQNIEKTPDLSRPKRKKALTPEQGEQVKALLTAAGELINRNLATDTEEDDIYGTPSNKLMKSHAWAKPKQRESTVSEDVSDTDTEKTQEDTKRENIQRALEARDAIIKATSHTYAGGKIIFNTDEQKIVKENVQELTDLILTCMSKEKILKTEGNIERTIKMQTVAISEMRNEIQALNKIVEDGQNLRERTTLNRAWQGKATQLQQRKIKHTTADYQIAYINDTDTEQTQTEKPTDTEGEFQAVRPRKKLRTKETRDKTRTYADVSKLGLRTESNPQKPKEPWKTPEKKERYITLVEIPEGQQAKSIIQKIKETAQEVVSATGGVIGMTETMSNKIAIVYRNKEQQEKVERKLDTSAEIKTKSILRQNPKIKLTGVAKGYSDEELLKTMLDENPDIKSKANSETATKLNATTAINLDMRPRNVALLLSATSAGRHTKEGNASGKTQTAPTARRPVMMHRTENTPQEIEIARSTKERRGSINKQW